MKKEAEQIALRYKGEDYKGCVEQLKKDGYAHRGFNEWVSPTTGSVYKFILADAEGYVTRVELMSDGQPELINTEFYDFHLAIKRFNAEREKPKAPTDSDIKQGVIHALFKFSPNQFTKELQKASRAGDAYVNMLYHSVGVEEGERIPFKNYFFAHDGTEHLAIAVWSAHKRYDRELIRTLQVGSKKIYIYRAMRLPEDMVDSLLGRASLRMLIGEEGLHEITLPNVY